MSVLAASLLVSCADETGVSREPEEAGAVRERDASQRADAGEVARDATVDTDAARSLHDASAGDAAQSADARTADVGSEADAASEADAGCGALTYENFGLPFLETWCLRCHTLLEPKLSTLALVRASRGAIRTEAVESKRMPEGGASDLTDAERAQLGRWLACGAP